MEILKRLMLVFVFCLLSGVALAKPININKANAQEIAQSMNGVGMAKAEAIVEEREKNGQFQSVEDIARVKGIGEVTLSKNRDNIVVE